MSNVNSYISQSGGDSCIYATLLLHKAFDVDSVQHSAVLLVSKLDGRQFLKAFLNGQQGAHHPAAAKALQS